MCCGPFETMNRCGARERTSTSRRIRIFASLRFGVSPAINATAAMILGLTLAAIVVAYLVLRRSGETEPGAGVPGV